jgi:hypothetical protein
MQRNKTQRNKMQRTQHPAGNARAHTDEQSRASLGGRQACSQLGSPGRVGHQRTHRLLTRSCACASPVVLPDLTSAQKQVLYCRRVWQGRQAGKGMGQDRACAWDSVVEGPMKLAAGCRRVIYRCHASRSSQSHQVVYVRVRLAPAQVVPQRGLSRVEHSPGIKQGVAARGVPGKWRPQKRT